MKCTVTILVLLSSIWGCNESKPKTVLSKKEIQVRRAKFELSYCSEKIILLSIIKKMSFDSLKLILTDYYSMTSGYTYSSDSSKIYSEKAISYISEQYHLPKRRVASIVFSFKYEMLSKEDILDEGEQEPPMDSY